MALMFMSKSPIWTNSIGVCHHLLQTFISSKPFFYCLTKCMLAGHNLIKIGRFAQNLILSKLTDIILTGLEKEEL